MKNGVYFIVIAFLFAELQILQGSCAARTTYFDNSYDVNIATYSLPDLLKWKMRYLLLQSLTDFLVLVLCNVHISSHPLNKQEQVTLPEGEKLWFYLLNGESLEPIVLPWKCLVIVPLLVLFRNNDNHLFFCCFNEMITTEYVHVIQRQWNFIWEILCSNKFGAGESAVNLQWVTFYTISFCKFIVCLL